MFTDTKKLLTEIFIICANYPGTDNLTALVPIFLFISFYLLIQFMLSVFLYTPWKYKKTSRFLMFLGGIERDQCHEIDYWEVFKHRRKLSRKWIKGNHFLFPIQIFFYRSSHQRCSEKKVFLKISQFNWKTLVLESLFNKLHNFIKKRLQHSCFLVNITKFLKILILKNICERLLLHFISHSDIFLI